MEDKVATEARKRGPGPPQDYHVNTKSDDYKLMHQTIQSMRHCEAAVGGTNDNGFVAILFEWQARLPAHESPEMMVYSPKPPLWDSAASPRFYHRLGWIEVLDDIA